MKELPLHEGHPKSGRSRGTVAVPAEYVPRRREDVLELDMGDGLVLYNGDASLVHHLNPSAIIVWQLCDGRSSVSALARDIAAEYELDEAEILEQVGGLIAEFEALDLVSNAHAHS